MALIATSCDDPAGRRPCARREVSCSEAGRSHLCPGHMTGADLASNITAINHRPIHAARVAATYYRFTGNRSEHASIHAARVGSDACLPIAMAEPPCFNPRCPCGQRRTPQSSSRAGVSIHAARVGSDFTLRLDCDLGCLIHAARVGSDGCSLARDELAESFQSTLPVWAAT